MAAAPLAAAHLPQMASHASVETAGVFDADGVNAQAHRRYYRRDRVDAGDVIGAVVVLGAIAAVASAASRSSQRDRDYRYPQRYPNAGGPYPNGDYRYNYRNGPTDSRYDDSRGLDRAVDMCAREVERNARIDTVDSVNRSGNGWDVTGRLRTGENFRCSIGNDGRIGDIDYGRGAGYRGDASGSPAPYPAEDRQWDDDRYAAARAAREGAPSYPGGPLPGDDDNDTSASGADGRYQTAQSPDFAG